MADPIKVKVTITDMDGIVLDQFKVANPPGFYRRDVNELAHNVREAIESGYVLDVED